MSDIVLVALIGFGGSATVGAAVSGLFAIFGKRAERKKGIGAGVRFLLHDKIESRCLRYLGDGKISADNLEMIIEAHRVYHTDLGGNGYLDALMHQVKQLPIIK